MALRREAVEEARKRYEAWLAEQQINNAAPAPAYNPPQDKIREPVAAEGKAGPVYAPQSVPQAQPTSLRASDPLPVSTPTYNPNDIQPTMRQPESLAKFYTDNAVPLDEITRQRRVNPAPEQQDEMKADYDSAYPTYDAKSRPTGAEGGDNQYDRDVVYERALRAYKPENHNNRFKSGLIQFGRGMLQGKGLMQSAAEGVEGLIDPSVDERYQQRVDLNRTGRNIAAEEARRKSQSDLYSDAADRDHKRTQDEVARRGAVYAPELFTGADGPVLVNKNNATFSSITNPEGTETLKAKPDRAGRGTRVQWSKDGVAEMWVTQDGVPKEKVPDWRDPSLDKVRDKNGNLIPQTTDSMARATEAAKTYERDYRDKMDKREVQWRDDDKREAAAKEVKARRAKADDLAGTVTRSRKMIDSLKDRLARLQARKVIPGSEDERADDIAKLEGDIAEWNAFGVKATTELGGYPEFYKAGVGDEGTPYVEALPFRVDWWKGNNPGKSKAELDAAIQRARDAGMEIVYPKDTKR